MLRGTTIRPDDDPAVVLAIRRAKAKRDGEERLAAALHPVTSALAYGIFGRADPSRVVPRGHYRRTWGEEAGPWTWPPLAACVPAGARLLLGLLDYFVSERGGGLLAADTDGAAVCASPTGGELITLGDGREVRALAYDELRSILDRFDLLALPGARAWKTKGLDQSHPLRGWFLTSKRYALFRKDDAG